ncbi:MAG: winged helix DNA-binding protein [Lachnospiraceae bacterium]|nr:winged helix DNA-binding protein [Lachnospiraceae bacterium]
MNRTEKEEYIIGCISLLSNKLTQFGDCILPDITFKQWFLLLMISKMEGEEKSINSIAEFVGSSRQNIKKMLKPLEEKGYVVIGKSTLDARALKVELTEKTYQYFSENAHAAEEETNKLFQSFSMSEIDNLMVNLEKMLQCLS